VNRVSEAAWCDALGVSRTELHPTLRRLWREIEELFGQQAKFRTRVYGGPDVELDRHLVLAERHLGEAAVLLGNSAVDAAREGM
jgi:hypothetical protein